MNKREWNEGLDHLDPDLVETYVRKKDRLQQKKTWLRVGAVAASLLLTVGVGAGGTHLLKRVDFKGKRIVLTDREYWNFETRVERAPCIVKATYEGEAGSYEILQSNGSPSQVTLYAFSVGECFRGDAEGTISVRFSGSSEPWDGISPSALASRYEKGNDYYLLLNRSVDMISPDYYGSFAAEVFLPADDLENALVDGEPLEKHAKAESVAGLKENPEAFFASLADVGYWESHQKNVIYETDLTTVAKGSDYILKVKVERLSSLNDIAALDRSVCVCRVITAVKGDIAADTPVEILLPAEKSSVGDVFLVAVTGDGKGTDTDHLLFLSSRNSVFDVSEEDEIRKILAEE